MTVFYKSENFESGATTGWQAASGAVVSPGFNSTYAYRMDSTTAASELNLYQAQMGADKLYWSVRFRFRLPQGTKTANPAVARCQNTDVQTGGGGGHADYFVDIATGHFCADLQPTDRLDTGLVVQANRWYLVETIGGFKPDNTSYLVLKVDGVNYGTLNSVPGTAGDILRNVRFGSAVALDAVVDIDNVMIKTSSTVLDFAPGVSSGSEIQAQLNRLAGTTGLGEAGAANVYAGTTNLETVGALNARAGTKNLDMQGVCNALAGTNGLGVVGALASIP